MLGATTALLLPPPPAIVVPDKRYWALDKTMTARDMAVTYWETRMAQGTVTLSSVDALALRDFRNPPVFRVYQKWVDPANYVAVDWHGGWRET
jgi:hypothetical protein